MFKFYYRVALSVLATLIIFACKEDTIEPELLGTISGTVLTSAESSPVSGALITTSPPSSSIVTDQNGKFSIPNIPVGNYSVAAVKSGFKKHTVSISVRTDQVTTATLLLEKEEVSNNAPEPASSPFPADQATNQPISFELSWIGTDPDGDSLSFDVFLFESGSAVKNKIASGISDTTVSVADLKYGTTYFWQVISSDTASNTTNGDLWSFTTVTSPNFRISFSGFVDSNYEIFISDESFENIYRLTRNSARDLYPRINPVNNLIAYSSEENLETHIYLYDLDLQKKSKLTYVPIAGNHNYGIGFCWSPDGTQIIYPNFEKLYKINADGSNLTIIATAPAGRNFRECEWNSTGDKIVALTIGQNFYDSEIYIMNTDGTNMTLFHNNEPGAMESPSFSPDGQKILFTKDLDGYENQTGRQLNSQILLISVDKSDTTFVSINKPVGINDFFPRFAPDGSKIIFSAVRNDNSGVKEIYTVETNGDNRTLMTSNGTMPYWK